MNQKFRVELSGGVLNSCIPHVVSIAILIVLLSCARTASAEDLKILLKPTAFIVGMVLDVRFIFLPSTGYSSIPEQFIIAPECSGMRFFILASCVAITLMGAKKCIIENVARITSILFLTYLVTIAANVARIVTLVAYEDSFRNQQVVSRATAHLFLGSFTYFLFLLTYAVFIKVVHHGSFKRITDPT